MKCFLMVLIILAAAPQTASASLFGLGRTSGQQYFIHDEESFRANTKTFHQIPFNTRKLEFEILLPKDWTSDPLTRVRDRTLKQDIPQSIARFKSPMIGTSQAVVTIQYRYLTQEISAENWLKNYAITNGYALEEQVTSLGGRKAGMSYISVFEVNSTYTYTAAQINGDIVALASFEIPLFLKESLGFLQKRTADSFRLLMPSDDPIEKQKEYALPDALHFIYPESWIVRYPDFNDGNNILSVQLHNEPQAEKVDGMIRFVAVRRRSQTSLAQEMTGLKNYLNSFLGIELKKLVSSDKAPAYKRFLFSRHEVYQVGSKKKNSDDGELRLVVLGDPEWYIIVFLMTPSKTGNFYAWAHNTQAFDLIVKNLR